MTSVACHYLISLQDGCFHCSAICSYERYCCAGVMYCVDIGLSTVKGYYTVLPTYVYISGCVGEVLEVVDWLLYFLSLLSALFMTQLFHTWLPNSANRHTILDVLACTGACLWQWKLLPVSWQEVLTESQTDLLFCTHSQDAKSTAKLNVRLSLLCIRSRALNTVIIRIER